MFFRFTGEKIQSRSLASKDNSSDRSKDIELSEFKAKKVKNELYNNDPK